MPSEGEGAAKAAASVLPHMKSRRIYHYDYKKDGRREAFDRGKVMNGIVKACEKRPVSMAEIERIVDEIERGLNNMMEKEIDSTFIGGIDYGSVEKGRRSGLCKICFSV